MANKNFNTRIINKHDTEENWSKANFIPKQGELIIYDKDDNYDIERFKIGDGITTVNNLPFRSIDGGYDALTEILSETTLNFTNNGLYLPNLSIELGKKYKVTFDGVDYELVGKNDPQDHGGIYIGNEIHAWDTIDTGEPFVIYTDMYDDTTIHISSSETLPCTHNIEIKAIVPIKIDEKYLDIKKTNIVNGSAIGSLRTIGSTEEGSEYEIGEYAFTEGYYTKASGSASHAEGNYTKASGTSSHAEGQTTKALGNASHAEGWNTKASGNCQHVQGKYNIEDSSDTYIDIIGNGSSDTKRSNASTVDWQGNAWYAGDVYVGSTSGKNKDDGSKKLATEEYVNSKIKIDSF